MATWGRAATVESEAASAATSRETEPRIVKLLQMLKLETDRGGGREKKEEESDKSVNQPSERLTDLISEYEKRIEIVQTWALVQCSASSFKDLQRMGK